MKLRSVRYLTGEGFKNIWVNRLMSIASIGVLVACMVLIGLALLISLNVDKSIGELEQQNVIMAYFNDRNSVVYGDSSVISSSSDVTSDLDDSSNVDSENDDSSSSKKTSSSQSKTSSKTSSEDTESKIQDEIPEDSYLIHNDEEAMEVCEEIEKLDNVAKVEFISAETALENLKDTYLDGREEYFTFLDDEEFGNPLSCGAKITMIDLSLFDETIDQIKNIDGVSSITSQGEIADKIVSIKSAVTIAGAWIVVILFIIALMIVSNTIRVTMYNRKLEISIMKVVGATDSFIRLPFIVEGVVLGLISAILSEGMVYLCYRIAGDAMKSALGTMSLVGFSSVALTLLGVFAAIGVLTGLFGSLIMISKYLKREGSEFRAL